MTKARMKELLDSTLTRLYNVMEYYMDCDDYGDFITENFTREEAEEFGEEGWFGEENEEEDN